jgi:hypothetical protein
MGIAIMLYTQDFEDRFPPRTVVETNGAVTECSICLGGFDPRPDNAPCFASAAARPPFEPKANWIWYKPALADKERPQ